MKNYCIFELAALAALTFASCSSESVEDFVGGGNQASQQVAIGFDGYLGRSAVDTRGSESDLPAIQAKDKGFGVFGNYTASDKTTPDYGQNMFKNQPVTYSSEDAKWTYTPVKYWPTAGHIDFLAYAPFDKNQELKNNKELDFTVDPDVTKQIDLLWANAANKTKASGKVNFTFYHALAKIGYSVTSTNNDKQTTITVKSLKLAGNFADENIKAFYTKGTIDLSKANKADDLWSISDDTKQNFTLLSDKALSTENKLTDNLFVIPQDFTGTANKLYVVVEYTVKTGESEITNKVYKEISKKFSQGKAYMINLTIGLTPIEFEATVESWPNDESIGDFTWN